MRAGGRLLALAQGELLLPWRLRLLPVCASTEVELSRWLHQGASAPLAVLARRQRHGRGQRQRHWQSPPGGLWLSAALPWQGPAPVQDPSQLPLVVAGAVAAELDILARWARPPQRLRLKAPNDLMVGQRKLAGVLTSAVWRGGELRQLRVGLGLNGRHPIAPPGITLEQWLGTRCPPWPRLALLGLRALERVAASATSLDTESAS